MKSKSLSVLCVAIIVILIGETYSKNLEPYKVLGIGRSASTQEIRKAYKNLAKEWHPDKNDSPGAQEKFVEINAAYELLSDPDRRRRYDQHGVTDEPGSQGPRGGGNPFGGRRFHSPFDFFEDEFFGGGGGGGFNFHFNRERSSEPKLYHKQATSSHAYYNTIVPESFSKPYLILFFSDFCFTCLRIEPIWTKLTEELEPVGFGVITVHVGRERDLARKIGSNEIPHMAILMDGKVAHYKDPQFSALKALDFVRGRMPYKLVEHIDESTVDQFLSGWHDNRVRVLLFGKTEVIRLRYLATAFKFKSRAKLGYVRLTNSKAKKITKKFNVPKTSDTMLVFHEDSNHPVASVSMQDLALTTLFEVIESHQFLQLPRLSSQPIMDQLCPESSKTRKRLCVVLVNEGKEVLVPEEELKRQALRDFVHDNSNDFSPDRIRFTYILRDIQTEFISSLNGKKTESAADLNLAILWRRDSKNLKYEWFSQVWTTSEKMRENQTQKELKTTLQKLLSPNEILTHEAVIRELLDEHAAGFFGRVMNRILETTEWLRDHLTKEEILPAISLVGAVLFLILGSHCLQWLAGIDEDEYTRPPPGSRNPVTELKLIEFKAETYNGLLRLLKPGCRAIVLIIDQESKDILTRQFYRMVWPYRKNRTLSFNYMFIEKGLPWFRKILSLASDADEPDQANINPRNCVGTVLALNGHRQYFSMFHARHPEAGRTQNSAAAFMGFDSDDEDENDSEVGGGLRRRTFEQRAGQRDIQTDNLIDALPLWLDRLFEGSAQRYYVNYWPEFPVFASNLGSRMNKSHAE